MAKRVQAGAAVVARPLARRLARRSVGYQRQVLKLLSPLLSAPVAAQIARVTRDDELLLALALLPA